MKRSLQITVLWVSAAAVMLASGMLDHVMDDPYSIHEWRQRDALSQTLRYMEPGRGFFEPAMHFQHADDGRGAGEFTGFYYLNAQLWKVIGRPLPWTLRWTQAFALLLGLLALSQAIRLWSNSRSAGAWAAWAVLVSPLIQFYGANYLVNPSALMAVFAAWWMWARSEGSEKDRVPWAVGAASMLLLAGLLRPTMLLGGIPLAVRWWRCRDLRWPLALGLGALVVAGVGAWVIWAKSYNAHHQSFYYLTTLRPIWDTPDWRVVWDSLTAVRLQEVYHVHVRYLGGAVLVATLAFTRLKLQHGGSLFLLTGLGVVAYILLWFKNLDVHDYYLLELLMLVPLAVNWVAQSWPPGRVRLMGWVLLATAAAYQAGHSVARNRLKWGTTEGMLVEAFVPKWERDEWTWYHADRQNRLAPLAALPEKLHEWGVPSGAWVLSLPDQSPNISLTLMGRFGYTSLFENDKVAGSRVAWAAAHGAAFLVVNKPEILNRGDWGPWLQHEVGRMGDIVVYDLRQVQEGRLLP